MGVINNMHHLAASYYNECVLLSTLEALKILILKYCTLKFGALG